MIKTKSVLKNILIFTCICCFVFWTGCRDCEDPTNPECSNYDPCYGVEPITASFTMVESVRWFGDEEPFREMWDTIDVDTAVSMSIIFEAPKGFMNLQSMVFLS